MNDPTSIFSAVRLSGPMGRSIRSRNNLSRSMRPRSPLPREIIGSRMNRPVDRLFPALIYRSVLCQGPMLFETERLRRQVLRESLSISPLMDKLCPRKIECLTLIPLGNVRPSVFGQDEIIEQITHESLYGETRRSIENSS